MKTLDSDEGLENEETGVHFWKERELGPKLRQIIQTKGLRITDVIRALDPLSSATFYKYIRGQTSPPIDYVMRLCRILDVPLATLLDLSADEIISAEGAKHLKSYSLHTTPDHTALYHLNKLMKLEEGVPEGTDRIALGLFPTSSNVRAPLLRKTEAFRLAQIDKHSLLEEISDEDLDRYRSFRRDQRLKRFERMLFSITSLHRFATGEGPSSLLSHSERIEVLQSTIDDVIKISDPDHATTYELGFYDDRQMEIRMFFVVLARYVIFETNESFHLVEDASLASRLRREQENLWHSQGALRDPDQVVKYLKAIIDSLRATPDGEPVPIPDVQA